MKKFSLELPKYRLAVNFRLIKRRKPLVPEPIIPSVKLVNKKYRKGTLGGKIIRHVSGHKNARRVMATNFAAFTIIASFLPISQASDALAVENYTQPEFAIIEPQNTLQTQKGTQFPLSHVRINQSYSFFHPGIDFGADVGDAIEPIKAGKVIEAGYATDGYGNTIVVDHGNGLTSRYAHLSKIETKVGSVISTNNEIGTVGITGKTTGPHLHLEVRQNGTPINPLSIIPR